MTIAKKLNKKLRESGVREVVASVLHHTANSVAHKRAVDNSNGKPADEFLAWVRFAVPGMLDSGNVSAMEHAVKHMPPGKPIVEIGSFCGLSTVVISHMLEKHSKTSALYSCDKWEFEGQQLGKKLGDSKSVTHDDYQKYVKNSFLRNMQTFASNRLPHTVECFSDEFFRRWFQSETAVDVFGRSVQLGGEIGFCYIDGNHTYEFAKRDFQNADRALASGGFILFDDSADGSHWEVNQLTRELAAGNQYELVSKSPNYLFRKH